VVGAAGTGIGTSNGSTVTAHAICTT
jgi:hypothetical protein